LLSDFALEEFKENQMGLKLSGTNQLVVSDDDVNLLGDNIIIIKKMDMP
jgi:hypothetical protein